MDNTYLIERRGPENRWTFIGHTLSEDSAHRDITFLQTLSPRAQYRIVRLPERRSIVYFGGRPLEWDVQVPSPFGPGRVRLSAKPLSDDTSYVCVISSARLQPYEETIHRHIQPADMADIWADPRTALPKIAWEVPTAADEDYLLGRYLTTFNEHAENIHRVIDDDMEPRDRAIRYAWAKSRYEDSSTRKASAFEHAMTRLLYTDEQIQNRVRFNVENPVEAL